ncbi:DNA polymerase III subunit gamma/tau [Anaerococcus sp. Marseille-Q7828]|uniref:DNA polymerase III subunit gamma/tau n=1 Tax=Anaerococcus sp. Marseille-Q7828 TaxID=3036300 RepID=UPI0024AE4EE2|nr:DNA polymerase III subunit gamma/tau [Anaerococcus sp. Marseille-Q7828]
MAKALYRQYRPKTFDSVLGQDRVVNVLKNQVKSGNISHAYLFSGERGTGKTTCAKIFAKAINCLNPKDGSPCMECENCKAIEEETTIDVVEMDAASNRRIDDIRNLKDNVIYPPNKLKYKVYIIDEAHMITREAFNALLKIMEEPPSHLVFILATTEIEKIPSTILSRLQKYEFNKIDENKIKEQIDYILEDRSISMENEAIRLIIKKANGAMRDALSILDQVLSLEKESYKLSEVENLLGVVDFYDIDKLARAIARKDSSKALDLVFTLKENNKTNKDIIDSLVSYFNDIMIYKMSENDKFFENEERLSFIKKLANDIDFFDIGDYLDILIDYGTRLKQVDNTDVLTELCILRLVKLKNTKSLESRVRALEMASPADIDDLVNKIVDNRLANLDNLPQRPNINSSQGEKTLEVNEPDETLAEDKDDIPREDNNQEDFEEIKERKLSKSQELQVQDMIIKTAGGIFHEFFRDQGLQYKIDGNKFILAADKEFYRFILEKKTDDIERNLMEILNGAYIFTIATSEDLNHNDNKKDTKIEKKTDNSQRLLDVFGEDLVIE